MTTSTPGKRKSPAKPGLGPYLAAVLLGFLAVTACRLGDIWVGVILALLVIWCVRQGVKDVNSARAKHNVTSVNADTTTVGGRGG